MSWIKAHTVCLVLSSLLFSSQSVPISIDKTKVKVPEEEAQEVPQNVVSFYLFEENIQKGGFSVLMTSQGGGDP